MPIGAVIVEFFSGIADAWRARRALKAQADMQAGADILNKAIREDAEMRAAAEAMEARKRLDVTLSDVPLVPAAPAPGVSVDAAPMPPPVPGGVASSPEDITARLRKP